MIEYEFEEYNSFENSDSRLSLLDGLIRLLEIRIDELERRISLLEEGAR